MTEEKSLQKRVCEFLTTVPYGKVVTYGQIAEHLGNRRLARAVGNALHTNPDPVKYPCYKVVNAQGRLAENFGDGGAEVQRARLEREGITVTDGKVDLNKFKWNPVGSARRAEPAFKKGNSCFSLNNR